MNRGAPRRSGPEKGLRSLRGPLRALILTGRSKNYAGWCRLIRWLVPMAALGLSLFTLCCAPHAPPGLPPGPPEFQKAVVTLTLYGQVFCAGVRVAPYMVLTAEHCLAAVAEAGEDGAVVTDSAGFSQWCRTEVRYGALDLGELSCPNSGPHVDTSAFNESAPAWGFIASPRGRRIARLEWSRTSPRGETYDLRRISMHIPGGCWAGESGSPIVLGGRVVGILILGRDAGGQCTAVAVRERPRDLGVIIADALGGP